MTGQKKEAKELCKEIACCDNVKEYFKGGLKGSNGEKHPCCDIIKSQNQQNLKDFQIPEPWAGYINKAPLLFLGSNPSIDKKNNEDYPIYKNISCNSVNNSSQFKRKDGTIVELLDFYNERLNDLDKGTKRWARYILNGVKNAAEYLYDGDSKIVHGCDYALSEVVHCKSENQTGVEKALDECSTKYLERILQISPAKVVVVFGKKAKDVILKKYGQKIYFKIDYDYYYDDFEMLHLRDDIITIYKYKLENKNDKSKDKNKNDKSEDKCKNEYRYFIFAPHPGRAEIGLEKALEIICKEKLFQEIKECLQKAKKELEDHGGCNGTI